jgi:hypothetical protein
MVARLNTLTHTSFATMKKCASLGGVAAATRVTSRRDLGLFLGIYWLSGELLLLVKE